MFCYIPYSHKDVFRANFPDAKFNKDLRKWELLSINDIDRLEKEYCHSISYGHKSLAKECGGVWVNEFKKWMFVDKAQYEGFKQKRDELNPLD